MESVIIFILSYALGFGTGWFVKPEEIIIKDKVIKPDIAPLIEYQLCQDIDIEPVGLGKTTVIQTVEPICTSKDMMSGGAIIILPVPGGTAVDYGEAIMFHSEDVLKMFDNKISCAESTAKFAAQTHNFNESLKHE